MAPDDRRAQIVAATRVAMNQFGVRRVTVSDVAQQAGLSRQTLYEYFPSREALVEAAMEAAGLQLIAAAEQRMPADATPVQHLAALIQVVLDYFGSSPLWSVAAKREEFVPHVTLSGGAFASAATAALADRLARWWPDAEDDAVRRAADTLARSIISHGLAPEDSAAGQVATELALLIAAGLGRGNRCAQGGANPA